MNTRRLMVGVFSLAALLASCGQSSTEQLDVEAFIDDQDVAVADNGNPVRVEASSDGELRLDMVNTSDETVAIDHIRIEGELLGMTFLSYGTSVDLTLQPGATQSMSVPLEFFDLDRQANGYLRASIRTYGPDRQRLSSSDFPADIRGRTWSAMGLFAVGLLVLTTVSLLVNLRAMAQRTLPSNRFIRGLRFFTTGLGIGLLLSVAFSVLRIFPLPTAGWLPLTLIPALGGFALGYLSPGAMGDDLDDELEDLREEMESAANS